MPEDGLIRDYHYSGPPGYSPIYAQEFFFCRVGLGISMWDFFRSVYETFDTNLNLVVIRLVQERKKSHMPKNVAWPLCFHKVPLTHNKSSLTILKRHVRSNLFCEKFNGNGHLLHVMSNEKKIIKKWKYTLSCGREQKQKKKKDILCTGIAALSGNCCIC